MKPLRKISEVELVEILTRHRLWLMKDRNGICADLSYMNLSRVNLEHKDLRGANLSYSNFEGASLNYSQACFMIAECSNFDNASLGSCDFIGASFENSTFKNSDLSYSVFNSANMTEADLTGSNMTFANLIKSNISLNQIGNTVFGENIGNAFRESLIFSKTDYGNTTKELKVARANANTRAA